MDDAKTPVNTPADDTRIRERAYAIWQSEGCPDGCADQHWAAAEDEVRQGGAARNGKPESAAPADAQGQAQAKGRARVADSSRTPRRRA